MGNLGAYQLITTLSKKVGGPKNLFFLTLLSGYGAGKGGEIAVKAVAKRVKETKRNKRIASNEVYDVTTEGESNEGLELKVGDKFKVLDTDGDSVLIEIIGNTSNPYFVSADFLGRISSYYRTSEGVKPV